MFGLNSREVCQGSVYDIQTQDHESRRLIETRVYREGRILSVLQTPYADPDSAPSREQGMSSQHEEVRDKVREGLYGLLFNWISRGAIAHESGEYLKALELFESVLSIDEAQPEANAYLEKIRAGLESDAKQRERFLGSYREHTRTLRQSGRCLEAARREAFLGRLLSPPDSGPRGREDNGGNKPPLPAPRTRAAAGNSRASRHLAVILSGLILILCTGVIFTDAEWNPDPDYQLHLGRTYLSENRPLQARNIFYRILSGTPRSDEAFLSYWETFRRRGDYDLAARILQPLLLEKDRHPLTALVLAEAHRMASRFSEASREYSRALRDGWPERPCKIGIGLCLLGQDNPPAAIELWEELLHEDEQDYRIYYCLGLAYRQTNRLGRASHFFMRALEKEPHRPEIYRMLGECLQGMHQQEKADHLLARAEQLDSHPSSGNSDHRLLTRNAAAHPACDPTHSPAACFPFSIL